MGPGRIKKFLQMSPQLIALKAKEKTFNRARKIRAKLSGTFPTDRQFYSALDIDADKRSLVDHYQQRAEPGFFISSHHKQELVRLVQSQYPESIDETIHAADEICHHTFDLLGSGKTSLGEEIDWCCDFKTGIRWEPSYHTEVNYINLDDPSDVKVPWELSRFQHLPTLGKAYWFTRNEKYALEFVNQITDWAVKNPPQIGVNWSCTMDVAIRAVNWIWGYYFFADSPSFSPDDHLLFLKSILAHGRHIANNLEYSEVRGNHYLSDLVGLVFLGVMFPEFKESQKWLDFGLKELILEMEKQVHPDGVDFEAAIGYHRLVLELFLSVALLTRINHISMPDGFLSCLEKMFEFMMHYIRPDGNAPVIGDADDGRLQILSSYSKENINDHRYLLAIGAVLFDRGDFAQAAGRFFEEALWLLSPSALDEFNKLKVATRVQPQSKDFTPGGFFILRHQDLYLICRCGDIGLKGKGGHGHCDQLSFEIFAGGRPFIIDPGAYVYTADPDQRNQFRGTRYHNTVIVDGKEQNRFDAVDLFSMRNDSRAKLLKWEKGKDFDIFEGEHFGYTRLDEPVIHRREIILDKRVKAWEIVDFLSGKGRHEFEWNFHFDVGVNVSEEAKGVKATANGSSLYINYSDQEGFRISIEEGWVSKSYGVKERAQVLKLRLEKEVPVKVKFRVEVADETGI